MEELPEQVLRFLISPRLQRKSQFTCPIRPCPIRVQGGAKTRGIRPTENRLERFLVGDGLEVTIRGV